MSAALKITLIYLVAAVIWVGGSDWFFAAAFPGSFGVISMVKGWGFVAVTSAILLVVLEKHEAQRDAVEAQLRELTIHDRLTGALNKYALGYEIGQTIARARRNKTNVFALFIGIDGLDKINGRFGVLGGDQLLAEIAQRLHGGLRESDMLGRIDDDTFVLVVEDFRDDVADVVASKVLLAVSQPFPLEGSEISVAASIGIAEYPDNAGNAEDLFLVAQDAMASARQAGPNKIVMAETAGAISF